MVPTAKHVPEVEIHHVVTKQPGTTGGYKGMAEGGTINAPAAIANAVGDALAPFGAVVDRLPITPEWIVAQTAQAKG